MTKYYLIAYGLIHGSVMLALTIWASLQQHILDTNHLWKEVWFVATITDTYLGFIAIALWFILTSTGTIKKIITFILIMGLGNIAIGFGIAYRAYRSEDTLTFPAFLVGERQ